MADTPERMLLLHAHPVRSTKPIWFVPQQDQAINARIHINQRLPVLCRVRDIIFVQLYHKVLTQKTIYVGGLVPV